MRTAHNVPNVKARGCDAAIALRAFVVQLCRIRRRDRSFASIFCEVSDSSK
jgi:hypothetical protein